MSQPARNIQTDVVIAGSGPGGATMARELSKKGKKVVLCEAGKNHQWLGKNSVMLLGMMDKMGMTFSKEGTWVLRPKTVGGASVVYCGTAVRPPPWLKEKYGIDLAEEVDEVFKEIPVQTLPDHLVGPFVEKVDVAGLNRDQVRDRVNVWLKDAGEESGACTTPRKSVPRNTGQLDFFEALFADRDETNQDLQRRMQAAADTVTPVQAWTGTARALAAVDALAPKLGQAKLLMLAQALSDEAERARKLAAEV